MQHRWVVILFPIVACAGPTPRRAVMVPVETTNAVDASSPSSPSVAVNEAPSPRGAVVGNGPANLWRDAGASESMHDGPEGPSPERVAADLRLATDVALLDTWTGMGEPFTVAVALHRNGAFFTYDAKISSFGQAVGEPIPDPRSTRGCVCPLTTACPCEVDRGASRKQGRVPAAAVMDLLTTFGARPLDARQSYEPRSRGSDNYPYVHFVVTVPGASAVHFTAPDQGTHWTRDGKYLYRLPDEKVFGLEPEHAFLNSAFGRLETALGVRKWIAEEHKLNPSAGPL